MGDAKNSHHPLYTGLEDTFYESKKMIDFSPFPNVDRISPFSHLRISIDTIRISPYKNTISKYIANKDFKLETIKSNSKISANVKKLLWNKQTTSLKRIIMPHFKNIIMATPDYLNQKSNYKKCVVTAFGLSQPNKPLHVEAKEELQHLFNKFNIISFDLSIDSSKPIDTSHLGVFGAVTRKYTTQYINKPLYLSSVSKICYYDKSFKDNLSYPLYRLELTIKTSGRLREMIIPFDEIELILNLITHI